MKIDTDGIFIRSDGKVICTLDSIVDYDGTRLPSKEGFEIARRICAAVNACENIQTEMLELFGCEFWAKESAELDRLRAQNKEFSFLLRQAELLDRGGYGLTNSWFVDARAALTKYDTAEQSA